VEKRIQKLRAGAALLVLSLSLFGPGCQLMRKTGWLLSSNPYEGSIDSAARGEAIYATTCASCHGPTGFGDGEAGKEFEIPPRNLRAYIVDHSTAYFAGHVAYGKTGNPTMPGFIGILSNDQVWHVTNYVYSLGGVVSQSPDEADPRAGRLAHPAALVHETKSRSNAPLRVLSYMVRPAWQGSS
jgi:mono/diheme cytochrome c family protein